MRTDYKLYGKLDLRHRTPLAGFRFKKLGCRGNHGKATLPGDKTGFFFFVVA